MKTPLILRCAALIAPQTERDEWLAEWRGELAYVRSTCNRTRTMAFCVGAFPDAFWMRRNCCQLGSPSEAHNSFTLESPARCLLLLTALAVASVFFALRSPALRDSTPVRYRDAEKLAMVSRSAKRPRHAEIPVEEYRLSANRPKAIDELAFYAPRLTWVHAKQFVFAVASPNLFALLGVPTPARGLILTRQAWRRYFDSDPRLVGRSIEIGGSPAVVAGIVSDAAWQLPGIVDGWLLDENRLDGLPPEARGYMVARLRTEMARSSLVWPMSVPNERGTYDRLTVAPLPGPSLVIDIVFLIVLSLLVAGATSSLRLGDYSSHWKSLPWATRIRRWMFLAAKLGLLAPVVAGGFLALCLVPAAPQGIMVIGILALRWALYDQRNRCPVCLRSLSHPVRIGEASHTFLEWYGTELLCEKGHGFLHVAEIKTSCYANQRWLVA